MKTTCFIALLLVTGISAAAQGSIAPLNVHIKQQKLTLYAERIPLSEILMEIGRQSDIKIHFSSSADETVSADLKEIPIEMGLKRLLRNYSHAFIYGKGAEKTEPVIRALFVNTKNGDADSALIWSPAKANKAASLQRMPANVAVHHTGAPSDRDPLQSMQAIDPLIRFEVHMNDGQPTENPLLRDPHEAYLKGSE